MSDTAIWNMVWGTLIIEEAIRCGVELFCISPGSRSTPLTLAAADNTNATTVVHFDERGMAYHALGAAKATGRPVALICTSGTALANYMPAVVEASTDGVPLLILTADRPPELHDISANQTIEQQGFFGKWVRADYQVPCPNALISPGHILNIIDLAIAGTRVPPGPTHVNCAFREPFLPDAPSEIPLLGAEMEDWQTGGSPWADHPVSLRPIPTGMDQITQHVGNAADGLIVLGRLSNEADITAARKLCDNLKWPVFADIASGVRLDASAGGLLCSQELLSQCRPDVILHVGGPATSKRVAQLYDNTSAQLIQIQSSNNPHKRIHHDACVRIGNIPQMLDRLKGTEATSYAEMIEKSARCAAVTLKLLESTEALTGAHVCSAALKRVEGGLVFLGNSFTVREADMFATPMHNPLRVFVNRGVSGIEGNIATAAGIARASRKDALAIIGDITAMHDLNSLSFLPGLKQKLTLVIVNNDGGGIFEALPISKQTEHFEEFFATPHGRSFRDAAAMFDIPYQRVDRADTLGSALDAAVASPGSSIVEVVTHRRPTWELYQEISAAIEEALD